MNKIEVRLPAQVIRTLSEIAELAGVSVPTLMKVIVATEVYRMKAKAQESRGA